MIPQGGVLAENRHLEIRQQPSQTYRLDWNRNRVVGMTDGLDAVKQAVFKILQTTRFEHLIYSSNYGCEIMRSLAADPSFVKSEIGRYVEEALLQDDRVKAIDDIQVKLEQDRALVTLTVETEAGSFPVSQEVNKLHV